MKSKQAKISMKTGCSKYTVEKSMNNFACKSLSNLIEPAEPTRKMNSSKPSWTWSTPQLCRKTYSKERIYERRKSSEWTKIRNTLEFIQRSRETASVSHIDEDFEKDQLIRHFTSLTFLGQLYDVEIESDQQNQTDDDIFD